MSMKLTLQDIEDKGLLLYKYKRGSVAQGTFIEGKSDIDTCSIFLTPQEQLLGLGLDYQDEVSDEKNDNVAWEFSKFMRLLLKSNPTVLEALFVDDEFVEYEHPMITNLKKYRNKFVTKQCFQTFGSYAVSQIKKARSFGKKCAVDETKKVERRTAMSFCYTHHKQGSIHIERWLANRGLRADFCGLNRIPHMKYEYGVFYDWGAHFKCVGYSANDAKEHFLNTPMSDTVYSDEKYMLGKYLTENDDIYIKARGYTSILGYKGIFKNNDSTQVRLSSIADKNDKPICYMSFNEDAFITHCKDYKDYVEWVQKRNPVRFNDNKGASYDCKNISHAFRLMNMCIEIAEGKGFNVNRSNIDREFLLDVKHHKYEYEEILHMLDEKKSIMDNAIMQSNIPDNIDVDFVNSIVVNVRKEQLGIK